MNRFTQIAIAPALAAAAVAALASPALAGEPNEDIVVTSHADMKAWQSDTTRTLNHLLEREPRMRNTNPSPGIVQLTFDMGDNGKPTNIALHSKTTNSVSVQAARSAVRRLDLSDVPVTNSDNARFIANIVFSNGKRQHADLMAQLEESERARIASGTAESEYIVLGG